MKTLVLLSALALTACATDPATTQSIIAAHQAAPPTLQVKCPAGGCEITYNDPNKPGLKMPTNGWDALTSLGNNVTSVVPILAMGGVAVQGFRALQGSGGVTTSTTVGSNSGANSGNSGRVSGSTMTDNTATPTVVQAPAPVIVTQPPPVIVQPATPIIVK